MSQIQHLLIGNAYWSNIHVSLDYVTPPLTPLTVAQEVLRIGGTPTAVKGEANKMNDHEYNVI